jgi:hypothetical protein
MAALRMQAGTEAAHEVALGGRDKQASNALRSKAARYCAVTGP